MYRGLTNLVLAAWGLRVSFPRRIQFYHVYFWGCYPSLPSASVDNILFELHNSSHPTQPHSMIANYLKEQYTVAAHAPNFDFSTGCGEIKRCEESKRTLKNLFASRLAEFNTTLKLLRITDQWYIVPVKFRFGQNLDFLALLLLPLAGGPKDWKHFDADWRLISSASFHTSSDNCERNTQKWNSNNRDCKKETIETWMWLRRSCGIKLREAECFATTR